jgi:gamma-glutamyltranspeptidase / glutathione hydrolase / leukotriene-C4 hydrolase
VLGYAQPLAGVGALGTHRVVEALKHAFAVRLSLGDPGPDAAAPFVNVTAVLADLLSPEFAEELR